MVNALTNYRTPSVRLTRPGLLGRTVFDDMFDGFFKDSFPNLLRQSTQGYPVADIYRNDDGDTVMEFALAGFLREDLFVEVKPEKRSITVRANSDSNDEGGRRIARRSFEKTYVNYDNNLNLAACAAEFENGLLRVVVPNREEAKSVAIEIK